MIQQLNDCYCYFYDTLNNIDKKCIVLLELQEKFNFYFYYLFRLKFKCMLAKCSNKILVNESFSLLVNKKLTS